MKSETDNWKKDAKAIKKLNPLSDVMVIVMGRDKKHIIQKGIEEGFPETELMLLESTWEQLIQEQALLSKNSKLIFAKNSSHSIHLDRPELIVKVVKEITNILS
ncbi:hypothetical protein [Planococcus soli]|nr:hypothetical protein [Planococcus soli]